MFKIAVIVCALAAAGAIVWVKSGALSTETAVVPAGMASLEELHAKARARDLPVQQIDDLQ
jgi:hypothetical protein